MVATMSQSLLHQVTYSDKVKTAKSAPKANVSQSLLHQVTYSDEATREILVGDSDMSQSLLHQVTYSDSAIVNVKPFEGRCLNPFYIRSRIPTILKKF